MEKQTRTFIVITSLIKNDLFWLIENNPLKNLRRITIELIQSFCQPTRILFLINIATNLNSNIVLHQLIFIMPTILSKHPSISGICLHAPSLSWKLKLPFPPKSGRFGLLSEHLFCLSIPKTNSYTRNKMLPSHLWPDWSNIYLYTKLTHKCIIVVLCSSAPIMHFKTL